MRFSRKSEELRQERRKLSRYWKEMTVQLGKKKDWYTWKEESIYQTTRRSRRKF